MTQQMAWDIIGDIHGHADRLEALLKALGYRERGGAWRHPDRNAIFVGDFIDRGPGQLRVLNLVRTMTDAGSARAIMGNHEFNAIAWATPDPDRDGEFLRPRHGEKGAKNRHQHEAFLAEVGDDSHAHREWIEWFERLPIWLEEPTFRVVHACWSPKHVESLRPYTNKDGCLTRQGIVSANRKRAAAYDAVETLLKGQEVELPVGHSFRDKDGHERTSIRTRWWLPGARTYREAYIGPRGVIVPDAPLPSFDRIPEPDRPTFIGHYWLNPAEALAPLSDRVACVDFSVARGGPLVAYRHDGETSVSANKFVAV